MKKSISDNQKRRGRPATGTAPLVGVRMTEELQSRIKTWAAKQNGDPALAEAIRRLVEIGLENSAPAKKSSDRQRARAAELAEGKIDEMVGKAPDGHVRKRRLLEGPSIAREVRVDRPRKK